MASAAEQVLEGETSSSAAAEELAENILGMAEIRGAAARSAARSVGVVAELVVLPFLSGSLRVS